MTSHQHDLAYAEMQRVKFQRLVITYVNKLIEHNEKANMSGSAYYTVSVNGFPHELQKDFTKLR